MSRAKKKRRLIFLTGGGTAGHVTANLALIDPLKKEGFTIYYVGRPGHIEDELASAAGLKVLPVTSGRINRNLSPDTLLLPFRTIKGIFQVLNEIHQYHPSLIFCKGGFVSWPVAVAGWLTGTRVVLHESDMTPGVANRMCVPLSYRICTTFEETAKYLPEGKAIYTGTPIRKSLAEGDRLKGLSLAGFETDPEKDSRPVVLVIGGSTGAKALNDAIRENLAQLTEKYRIIHLYGKDSGGYVVPETDENGKSLAGSYFPLEYASSELPDIYACTDVALSRAGSNTINEFLMLKIPSILVPLPKTVSRGDQIQNAAYFEKKGFALRLDQENLNGENLMEALSKVMSAHERYTAAMAADKAQNGTEEVVKVINEAVGIR